MKPISLTIKGLNSFIEEQHIDFEKLTKHGLFGVFGPTGSGKSTILDGITIALYGRTSRDSSNFINTQCERMQIKFTFAIRDDVYEVTRTYKRTKKGNINADKPTRLIQIKPEETIVLEEQTKQVNATCLSLIGLKFEDFVRTVVLPQGKFSEFLKLKNKDRSEMLERLFSLGRYGDELSAKLGQTIKKERGKQAVLDGKLELYEAITQEYLSDLKTQLKGQNEAYTVLEKNYQKANQSLIKAKQQMETFTHYERLLKEEANLVSKTEEMATRSKQVKTNEMLLALKPAYLRVKELKVQVESLTEGEREASLQAQASQKERKALDAAYEVSQTQYHEAQVSYEKEGLQIDQAIEWQESIRAKLAEEQKLQERIKELEQAIKTLAISQEALLKEIQDQEAQVSQHQKTLESAPSVSLLNAISKGQMQEQALIHISKQVEELNRRRSESQQQVTRLDEAIEALKKKHAALVPDFDEALCLDDVAYKEAISKLQERKQNALVARDKQQALKEQLESLELKLKELSKTVNDPDQLKAFKRHERSQAIIALQSELKDHEPCPVCKSQVHHLVKPELAPTSGDYLMKKYEYDSLLITQEEIVQQEQSLTYEALDQLDEALEACEEKYNNFRKLQDLKKERMYLQGQIQDKQGQRTQQADLLSTLTLEVETLKDRQNEQSTQLHKALQELGISSFDSYKQQLDALQPTYDKAKEQVDTLLQSLQTLKDQSSQTREKSIQVTAEYEHQNVKYNEVKTERLKEEDKLHSIYPDQKDLHQLKIKKEAELTRLAHALDSLTASRNACIEKAEKHQYALQEMTSQLKVVTSQYQEENQKLIQEMAKTETDFESLSECQVTKANLEREKEVLDNYRVSVATIQKQLEAIDDEVKKLSAENMHIEEMEKQLEAVQTEKEALHKKLIELEKDFKDTQVRMKEKESLLDEAGVIDHQISLLTDLEKLFRGKKFVEFVAVYQLKYVAIEASKRLFEITSGKYGLEIDEDGIFFVRDYSYGGVLRETSTLSGGETFIVALSLALSLSSQIQLKGTAPLELFFLDEGFGTLDDQFLEVVMSSLEKIHHRYLSVGLISHVESIKNRVPVKLNVTPSQAGEHGSRVEVSYT